MTATMARSFTPSHSVLPNTTAVILLFLILGTTPCLVFGEKTWCIAKPSSDVATLLANINYACSQVDCGMIQSGHPCFYPDTPISHASIAMNLYYQAKGRNAWNCYFSNSGLLLNTNPSYGSCVYA
ncbi:glucan endo-1,3-beta-D-glucosidase-like [Phalaenopsis equestris]|uniref:glucan endo-1,3-beta-D-glucosidase-like n=1 Tax=Phalaenopsis equestris TaxID=78828 RepID=UPI0009E44A06|nr:glucan endo-1,3-beta-D-glucosidase-like [Phalaenopsis equestris]